MALPNPLEGAMGGWWFWSSLLVPVEGPVCVCRAEVADTLGLIAECRVVPGNYTQAGGVYTVIDYTIHLRYATPAGVVDLVAATPVPDPALGQPSVVGRPRSEFCMAWRFAVVFQCSTWDAFASTYAADGSVQLFVNGSATALLSAINVTIPRRHTTGQLRYTVAALGDGDRVWARTLPAVPPTTSGGALVSAAPADLLYFDDFDGGVYPDWTPVDLFSTGGFEPTPHAWPDCGGDGGWGISIYASGPNDAAGEPGVVNHSYAGLTRLVSYPSVGPPEPPEVPPIYDLETRYIRRLRCAPHLTQENTRVFYHRFELDLERGVGLPSGPGADPLVQLRCSRDGGQTWGAPLTLHAGALGAYTQRVLAWRLGYARDMVFEVTVTDPVAWSLVGAWLDLAPGSS